MAEFEYQETNGIPICPYCQKPTRRRGGNYNIVPIYNEEGKRITIHYWTCLECGRPYQLLDKYEDGFEYVLSDNWESRYDALLIEGE